MSAKTATVSVRIQPEIKKNAENVLETLGISTSVLIDALYRQIILTRGVPFSLNVPSVLSLEQMSQEDLNEILSIGLMQAKNEEGHELEDAFKIINSYI